MHWGYYDICAAYLIPFMYRSLPCPTIWLEVPDWFSLLNRLSFQSSALNSVFTFTHGLYLHLALLHLYIRI